MLIAYDRDAAGDRAAVKLAVQLVGAGIDAYRVRFPQGMDANAFAVDEEATAQRRLGDLIRKAAWLGKGKPLSLDLTRPSGELHRQPGRGKGCGYIPPWIHKATASARQCRRRSL